MENNERVPSQAIGSLGATAIAGTRAGGGNRRLPWLPLACSLRATMLVHSVFFWLKEELSAAQRAEFRREVETLTTLRGVERGFVGTPAAVAERPVVDRSYSVGLTLLFRDRGAHDAYQVDPAHQAFLTRFKASWVRVQIYDCE
ncbi:MAG: Dabb family protein [Opitutaceae bacterium]|nr:Dabb family protein [Opitutaceae bacterium]